MGIISLYQPNFKLHSQLYKNYLNNLKLIQRVLMPMQKRQSIFLIKINLNQYINYLNYFLFFTYSKIHYFQFLNIFKNRPIPYIISLNFKRLRFFPGFKNTNGLNFTNLSLGLLNMFFQKGKFF